MSWQLLSLQLWVKAKYTREIHYDHRMNTSILLLNHNITGPVFLIPFPTFHDSHPLRMSFQVRQLVPLCPRKKSDPQVFPVLRTREHLQTVHRRPRGTLSLPLSHWLQATPHKAALQFWTPWLTGHSVRIWDSEAGVQAGWGPETQNPPEPASSPRPRS